MGYVVTGAGCLEIYPLDEMGLGATKKDQDQIT